MPIFPEDMDLSFKSATSGDLTDFYYLACGEEEALRQDGCKRKKNNGRLALEEAENIDSSKSGKTNGHNKKSKPKKSKGNNTSAGDKKGGGDATAVETFSIVDTERRLHNLNEKTRISTTIRLSGFHPPPAHRHILGDLAYLEVNIPGITLHITAFPLGFYVNRSTSTSFDPTPANDACYSHSLLDCILQRSQNMRTAWSNALAASEERAEVIRVASASEDSFASLFRPAVSTFPNNNSGIGSGLGGTVMISAPSTFTPRIDSVTVRPSWIVPLPAVKDGSKQSIQTWDHGKMHQWNVARAEEELSAAYGMDVRGGGLRDWNEELQAAREYPVTTLIERMDRARMLHKVLSDFGDAALKGVKAICDGYIAPMNANEPARSHVYLHNNIFFSRAVDAGLDTFKLIQGDKAAKKSASREAQNVGMLHRLDIPGLYTLGTVLVEYLGTRFVCQSVVPGILHGDKAHTLTYGAVEALQELHCEEEMHKLIESCIGEGCMVSTRTIFARPLTEERVEIIKKYRTTPLVPEKETTSEEEVDVMNKTIKSCGPTEMKGILGSDKRRYVLDCTRLTPRDANWVSKASGGTGVFDDGASDNNNLVPDTLDDDEWTVCVLRPELVTSYAEGKVAKFLRAQAATDGSDKEGSEKDSKPAEKDPSGDTEEKEWVNVEAEKTKESNAKAEEQFIRSLRYNVNVFIPGMRSIEAVDKEAYDQLQKDEEEARQLAVHLWDTVIPKLSNDAANGASFELPVDGKSLTELIHQRGINCRYLGRLAELAKQKENEDEEAEKAYEKNKREAKLPRHRMPLTWLELLECEIVARAAKHVLDSYLLEQGGVAAAHPAQTVASFLSAVLSTGEESASETDIRLELGGDIDVDDINALAMSEIDANGTGPIRGRSDIWSDIEKEIGRRFRYTLSLYNTDDGKSRALYTPLLRRICQRSGIRIVAKKYKLGGKCVCGGSQSASYPIAPVDIIDILPLVKHAASTDGDSFAPCSFNGNVGSPSIYVLLADAKAMYEASHTHLNSGNFPLASDYAQEAAALYQRVVDTPLHSQIAKCLMLASKAHLFIRDTDLAHSSTLKYLAVAVSLGGFDCNEVVTAHMQLSTILLASGQVREGMKHMRAMQFLVQFMLGKNASANAEAFMKIGSQYFELDRREEAVRFYREAAKYRTDDRIIDAAIASSSAIALAHLQKFEEACSCEKAAYQLYTTLLGEEHARTKQSSNTLLVS